MSAESGGRRPRVVLAAPLPPPHQAADLDREATSWPEFALAQAELDELETALDVPPPVVVTLPEAAVAAAAQLERLALRDHEGVLVAVLSTAEDGFVLQPVRRPQHPDYPELRLSPQQWHAQRTRRGWQSVTAQLTDRPLHTADLRRLSDDLRQAADGVLVALLAGGVEPTDAEHHARVRALRAGLAELPRDRACLLVLPYAPSSGIGERAEVARRYELPVAYLSPAPGSPPDSQLDELLDADAPLPPNLTPPAVAAELRQARPPRHQRGFTVFFTGLSGSGKSTLANLLAVRLLEIDRRRVTLLDGDRVRRHLTAGLGFSKADRDTNVRRIGWVAAQVTAAGGIAVCAPIAPYDATRRDVRAMVAGPSGLGGFVLVHVATPLEECERRDRKGLYAKARAGLLPEFTGVSDPYEPPQDADVVVDTTGRDPVECVEEIVALLRDSGWVTGAETLRSRNA